MNLKSSQVSHPVYPADGDAEELKRETGALMAMSDAQIREMIDEQGSFEFVPCPACDGNTHEGRNGTFDWSVDAPDEIRCTTCGTVYPDNAYPSDGSYETVDPTGKPQVYRYCRAANGRVCFLEGHVRLARYRFLRSQAQALAQLYGMTGDGEAAHRAGVILHRFAEVYPHWPVSGIDIEEPGRGKGPEGAHNFFFDPRPPYPNRSGKWTWWHYMEIPSDLMTAYDLIYDSGALEPIAADAKARIEEDMLRPSVGFVEAFWPGDTTNMAGSEIRGRIVSGRVLGEPGWVHQAVDHIRRVIESGYFHDGMWREGTPAYHRQITGSLNSCGRLLKGYTDPQGYQDELTEDRYDDLDLGDHFPILNRALTAHLAFTYPNGQEATVHDAWAGHRVTEPYVGPASRLLPATGHAILAVGEGEAQLQAHLHFCLTDGHAHRDLLNLSLFAKGRELLSDFGYTHTYRRAWATCTLGHNTVLVDGADQAIRRRETWGNLRLYEVGDPVVQVASASSETVYPSLERYRRTVAVVDAKDGEAYVVDIFRVVGGRLHEWALHGAADADQGLELSVPTEPAAESLAALLAGRGEPGSGEYERYAEVYEVASGDAKEPWTATFRYSDGEGPRIRTTYLGPHPAEVVSGMAPSIHRASRENALVDKIRTPIFVARRKGSDLQSAFFAVHEPYAEAPFLDRIEPLAFDDGLTVGARIVQGDRTDLILSTAEEDGRAVVDDVGLCGRLGVVRMYSGEVERLVLVDGSTLRAGGISIGVNGRYEGEVLASARDLKDESYWFDTEAALPEGEVLQGRTLVLSFANGRTQGCRIAQVEKAGARWRIHLLDDPGIEVGEGKTRMCAFPYWEFESAARFEVAGCATLVREGAGAYRLFATGDVTLGLLALKGVARISAGGREAEGCRLEGGMITGRIPISRLSAQGSEIRIG